LIGPELPPVYKEGEKPTDKIPQNAVCIWANLYGLNHAVAFYAPGFNVPVEAADSRFYYKLGAFTCEVDSTGQVLSIRQEKDGTDGAQVRMDGENVIVGNQASSKNVARVGDKGKLVIPVGTTITGVTIDVMAGTLVFTTGTNVADAVEITSGTSKLQAE
jgi:hypothetical protein